MIKSATLTEEDKELMTRYNINSETRTTFHYEGHKYDKLEDALNYAKLSMERAHTSDDG